MKSVVTSGMASNHLPIDCLCRRCLCVFVAVAFVIKTRMLSLPQLWLRRVIPCTPACRPRTIGNRDGNMSVSSLRDPDEAFSSASILCPHRSFARVVWVLAATPSPGPPTVGGSWFMVARLEARSPSMNLRCRVHTSPIPQWPPTVTRTHAGLYSGLLPILVPDVVGIVLFFALAAAYLCTRRNQVTCASSYS